MVATCLVAIFLLLELVIIVSLTSKHTVRPHHKKLFQQQQSQSQSQSHSHTNPSKLNAKLCIEPSEGAVGEALSSILVARAQEAIAKRGEFSFCISGGSMIKMLSYLKDSDEVDWSKCTMGFVSHRCVALDDEAATYKKALSAFLESWTSRGLRVVKPSGELDARRSAEAYEKSLRALPSSTLPFNSKGYPVFDLLLIGVGTDGHVGSIYPNIQGECGPLSSSIVVPVTEPANKPTKISFSLNTMLAAGSQVVACAGKSAKAPLGKAEAMVRGLEAEGETAMTFPARALRDSALWLLDDDSALLLKKR